MVQQKPRRQIRVRSIRRDPIDEDKLALAFLLMAKNLDDQNRSAERASQTELDFE